MGNSLAKTLTMSRGGGNWDKHISIFSNSGRLYQVEYTFRAARTSGFTSLALKGEGCAVVLTQKKVPEQLMDPATVSNLHTITPTVGCVTTGRAPDSRSQIARARQTAHKHEYDFGYAMPVDYLASRIAASNQTYTQQAGTRPAAVFLMFVAIDDEKGPLVYKVDPAGFTASYKATCAGDKEVETNSALEKLYRDGDNDGMGPRLDHQNGNLNHPERPLLGLQTHRTRNRLRLGRQPRVYPALGRRHRRLPQRHCRGRLTL